MALKQINSIQMSAATDSTERDKSVAQLVTEQGSLDPHPTEEAGQFDFVTFDSGHKHLAKIVAVAEKKVTIRRYDKKTDVWQVKEESRERRVWRKHKR